MEEGKEEKRKSIWKESKEEHRFKANIIRRKQYLNKNGWNYSVVE